jgi:peptidyl-dipeptidase Dcp
LLDDVAFCWFLDHGGLSSEIGQRFRDMILSRGNTLDYQQMYKAFRGRAANIKAMVKNLELGDE